MEMTGAPKCFEVLHHQKMLTEWFPDAFAIFVSHEWLGRDHPDITGNQTHCLRMALFNIMEASVKVGFDVLTQSLGFTGQLSAEHADKLKNGYMWMDWMCLPQNHLENNLDSRMPLFVQRCAIFMILAPKLLKTSTGTMSSYASYERRGWCRAEIWFKQMCIKPKDVPIILITDTEGIKFLRPVSWVHDMVHTGAFTIASDCERLNRVMESLMSQKLSEFLVNDLTRYRYFSSRFEEIVGRPRRERTLEEFLRDFKFSEKSLRSSSGMGPLACAVLTGDVALLPTLVEKRASLCCAAPNMMDVDIIPGMTPLALAAKSRDPESIIELVKLRANVNETDILGTCVLGHAGSPEVVQVLLDLQADVNQRKGPFGLSALSSCILRALQPEGLKLMLEAKASVNVGAGMYSFSPLTTATLFREMPRNVETCHLLLDARADINYREGFYVVLNRLARGLCCLQRHPSTLLEGIASCNGGTPLYIAAWFGNPEMVNLLLEAKADPEIRNNRGESYLDALNFTHSGCGATSMTWQIQNPDRWAVHEPKEDAKDTVESVPQTKDSCNGEQSQAGEGTTQNIQRKEGQSVNLDGSL